MATPSTLIQFQIKSELELHDNLPQRTHLKKPITTQVLKNPLYGYNSPLFRIAALFNKKQDGNNIVLQNASCFKHLFLTLFLENSTKKSEEK